LTPKKTGGSIMSATQAGESDNLGSKARPPRIAPVEPPYSPTIESMLKKWMKNKPELEVLNIYRTFAVHDELGPRTGVLGAGILAHGRLSAWEREILIHRVTARAGAEYEWGSRNAPRAAGRIH
jgi:hypothetical protein